MCHCGHGPLQIVEQGLLHAWAIVCAADERSLGFSIPAAAGRIGNGARLAVARDCSDVEDKVCIHANAGPFMDAGGEMLPAGAMELAKIRVRVVPSARVMPD